jgi:hypothetical protein
LIIGDVQVAVGVEGTSNEGLSLAAVAWPPCAAPRLARATLAPAKKTLAKLQHWIRQLSRGKGHRAGVAAPDGQRAGLSNFDPKQDGLVTADDLASDDLASLIGIGGGESHSAPYTGTKALMLAVLVDAIRNYLSPEPGARAEAEGWVRSRQRRSVFSFIVVCETLGLEPKAVRPALRNLRAQQTTPAHIPRGRSNVRRGTDRCAIRATTSMRAPRTTATAVPGVPGRAAPGGVASTSRSRARQPARP